MRRRALAYNPVAGLTPLQESIVAAWDFDGDSVDRIGGNNGTDTNVTYTDVAYSSINDYAYFDSSAKIEVADDDSLSFGASAWSFAIRLQLNSTGNQIIFQKRNTTTGDIEYSLLVNGGDLWFRIYDGTTSNYIGKKIEWNYTGAPTADFRSIIGTVDGSGTTAGIKLYENGSLATMTAVSGGSYTEMDNTAAKLWMGVNSEAGGSNLLGRIEEFYLFNIGLDATQSQFVSDEGAAGRTLI